MTNRKFLDILKSYEGATHGSAKHFHIIDVYNAFIKAGKAPKSSKHLMTSTDPWCAATVSAAAIEAGCTDLVPVECSCTRMISLYEQMGRYNYVDFAVPEVGWIIFYKWQMDNGKDIPDEAYDVSGKANHVGVVTEVINGKKIRVLEGNYNGKCQYRTIKVGWKYIHGFGMPKWDEEEKTTERLYTVVKGDSLSKIASKLRQQGVQIKWPELAEKNGISFPYTIYAGQKLKY